MALPYPDLSYNTIEIGTMREMVGGIVPASVTATPQFAQARHMATGDLIYGTAINASITEETGGRVTLTLLSSDQPEGVLDIPAFDWVITVTPVASRLSGLASANAGKITKRIFLPRANTGKIDFELAQESTQADRPELALPVVVSIVGLSGHVTLEELQAAGVGTGDGGGTTGGTAGNDGLSAYEVWVAQGNEGTVETYLNSLQGEPGPTGPPGGPGPAGPPGTPGPAGADGTGVTILGSYATQTALTTARPTGQPGDAYLVAGDLYVWSETTSAWENVGTIQGPRGEPGPQGVPGPTGERGLTGATGERGVPGETGQQGVPGVEGPPGPPGADGAPGATGATGERGLTGATGQQGIQGIQGLPGAKGDPGTSTVAGITDASTSGKAVLGGTPAQGRTALEIVTADITVSDIVASGTRAATTYLAGDGTWRTPAGGGGGTAQVVEPERSVEDFGTVDPTGQNDSGPGFRAAIAALKASGTYGGELVIRRPGRYRIDPVNGVGLELGPGGAPIKLTGIGYMQDQGATKFATLVPGAAMEALIRVTGYDCILQDLQVDGTLLADRAVDLKAPACRIVQCGITGGRLWALAGTSGAGDSTSSHRTTIDGGFFKNTSTVAGGGTMWTEGADWIVGGSVRILGGVTTMLAKSSGGQYSNLHVTAGGGITSRTLDVDGIQQTFMGLYLDSANAGNDLVTVTSGLDTRLIGCHIYQNIAAACGALIRVNGGSVQVSEMSARQTGSGGTWAAAVHIATAYSAARSGVWNSNFPMGTALFTGNNPAVWRDIRHNDVWQSKP